MEIRLTMGRLLLTAVLAVGVLLSGAAGLPDSRPPGIGGAADVVRADEPELASAGEAITGTMRMPGAQPVIPTRGAADVELLARMQRLNSALQQMNAQLGELAVRFGVPAPAPTPAPGMAAGGADAGMQMAGGLMADEPVADDGALPATESQGLQPLAYRLENGVKVFELTAKPVKWNILQDVQLTAWTFNGTVPGPMIRVTEGDRVRVIVKNTLPDPISIHWHGLSLENSQDGVAQPPLTQEPVMPSETFTYEFTTATSRGTNWYHSHVDTDRQINVGMFGAIIVDPKEPVAKPDRDFTLMLNEWRYDRATGKTYPAMPGMGEPNYFTVNGKAHPDIPELTVKRGERVRVRFIGAGQFEHPMHLHGMPFKIVATDGHPVPEVAQLTKDTISVHPGERYDLEFIADNPGRWAFHCHIVHHTTNDDVEPGGLMFVLNVQ